MDNKWKEKSDVLITYKKKQARTYDIIAQKNFFEKPKIKISQILIIHLIMIDLKNVINL